MNREQMELHLVTSQCPRPTRRQSLSPARARWWFEQMRLAVDRAVEWQSPTDQMRGQMTAPSEVAHPQRN